jgi:hypothetical protein
MKDYIDLAQRPFLYFWRLATSSVSARGKGQDPVRRDEKTKSVVVRRPNKTNQPTSQKKQNFVGPRWGAKNLPKRS